MTRLNGAADEWKKSKAERAKAEARKERELSKGKIKPETFAKLIEPCNALRYHGFLYLVYVSVMGEPERVYAGSKSYHEPTKPWSVYTSSSIACRKLIEASQSHPDQVKVRFEVVDAKQLSSSLMRSAESKLIWSIYKQYGKDRTINIRDAHGVSLRTGKMIAPRSRSKK